MKNQTCAGFLVCGWLPISIGLAVLASTAAAGGVELLNANSPYRFHLSWRTPATVARGQYDMGGGRQPSRGTRWVRDDFGQPTPPPPADWMQAGFDDSGWPRRVGPVLDPYGYGRACDVYLACVRARFGVTGAAKRTGGALALNVGYRGGIVVYVNGVELARGHLPGGPLEALTLAQDYPADAFVDADGQVLPSLDGRREGVPGGAAGDCYRRRVRRLKVEIPARLLAEGANVLAIEMHRAAIPAEYAGADAKGVWGGAGLVDWTLEAPAADGYPASTNAPAAPRVWVCDTHVRAGVDQNRPDWLEPARPAVLAAPRNGVCSAQVVVSSDAPMPGVKASLDALTSGAGDTIAPDRVRIRYAAADQPFPALLDRPPASAPLQPVWLTVSVPADARPGTYRGTLTVAMDAGRIESVPVELTVYAWTLPPPGEYHTSVSLLQCPESVAGHYKVPMWSDDHFRLLEKSMALQGYGGNTLVSVAVLARDYFGDQPAIVFRKEGEAYLPDFRFARRFLETYGRVAPPPRQVSVQVWNYNVSRRGTGRDGGTQRWLADTLKVHLIEGGRTVPADMPVYTAPGMDRTWAAVLAGMKQILGDLGWSRTRLLWGTGGDCLPNEEIVEFFKKIDPLVYWRVATHGSSVSRWGPRPEDRVQSVGLTVGYANMVRRNIWMRDLAPDCPIDVIKRDGVSAAPMDYLTLPPLGRIAAKYSGLGFLPFDYWTFAGPDGRPRTPLASDVGFGNITPHCARAFVMPGPDGAVSTPQLEALREGLQIAEVALALRAATAGDAARAAEAEQAIQWTVDVMESNRRVHPSGAADIRRHVRRLCELASQIPAAP